MAGAGVKLFLSGEIAYAADINQYLMDQSVCLFLDEAERNGAFGDGIPVSQAGSGKPLLTPGRICFLLEATGSTVGNPIRTIQYYDGNNWIDSPQFAVQDGAITSAKIADGAIMNIDVNASAAIAHSKLATTTAGNILLGTTTTGVVTGTAVTGDVTITGAGVTAIGATKITNAMLAGSIAHSKLATTTAGNILLGTTTTGVITGTAITGDVTITGAGVTTIGTGAVTSAKLDINLDLNGSTEIDEVIETVVINGTALTGTVQIDAKSGSVHYFTANSAANWIWNLRGDGSTTLNSMMDVGQAITFSLFATIGTTAYKPTSITVDTSGTVAVKWFGGNAYPSGNVSSIDCYTITVVKTATSTFTAFASQSKFA